MMAYPSPEKLTIIISINQNIAAGLTGKLTPVPPIRGLHPSDPAILPDPGAQVTCPGVVFSFARSRPAPERVGSRRGRPPLGSMAYILLEFACYDRCDRRREWCAARFVKDPILARSKPDRDPRCRNPTRPGGSPAAEWSTGAPGRLGPWRISTQHRYAHTAGPCTRVSGHDSDPAGASSAAQRHRAERPSRPADALSPRLRLDTGVWLEREGRLKEAAACFQSAIACAPVHMGVTDWFATYLLDGHPVPVDWPKSSCRRMRVSPGSSGAWTERRMRHWPRRPHAVSARTGRSARWRMTAPAPRSRAWTRPVAPWEARAPTSPVR